MNVHFLDELMQDFTHLHGEFQRGRIPNLRIRWHEETLLAC
jgi:hypothetical protein